MWMCPFGRHTWLQTARGGGPAHHGRDCPDQRSDPGVGDAESFKWRVATGVQKDVEGAQEAR